MKPRPAARHPLPTLTESQLQSLHALRERFAQLPDTRVSGRCLHRVDEMLMIAFCSMLSDNDNFTDMEVFAETQLDWLRTFLTLENGAPSHDVFRALFMAVEPSALTRILGEWCGDLDARHVAIDGKVLRGAIDPESGKSTVHVLRAWVDHCHLSAGQVTCLEKSNELEALPRLLDSLALKGAVVSIDAMGTHKAIAGQITAAGADYVLALKGNEKLALKAVAKHFESLDEVPKLPEDHWLEVTEELSHGRFEKREIIVTQQLDWWPKSWTWPGLKSVVRVRRWSHRGGGQSGELVLETHYYLSSLPADAKPLAKIIRGHWAVENRCHWVLDVVFGEDHCQVRDARAAHNLCIVREITLKALKSYPDKRSLRAKRKRAALDPSFRSALLAHIMHPFDA